MDTEPPLSLNSMIGGVGGTSSVGGSSRSSGTGGTNGGGGGGGGVGVAQTTSSNTSAATATTTTTMMMSLQNEQAVVRKAGRQAIRQFLESHNCFEVLRTSGKVVVFDTRIPIQLAFYALVEHDMLAAPLWDPAKCQFVGLLTVTDFIDILRYYRAMNKDVSLLAVKSIAEILFHTTNDDDGGNTNNDNTINSNNADNDVPVDTSMIPLSSPDIGIAGVGVGGVPLSPPISTSIPTSSATMSNTSQSNNSNNDNNSSSPDTQQQQPQQQTQHQSLQTQPASAATIAMMNSMMQSMSSRSFHGADSACTLYQACEQLLNVDSSEQNFLPIVFSEDMRVLACITFTTVLEHLVKHFREQRRLFDDTIIDLGIGTYHDDVATVYSHQTLSDALDIMYQHKLSALPVVEMGNNGRKKIIGVYSRSDITFLTKAMDAEDAVRNLDMTVGEILAQGRMDVTTPDALRTCSPSHTLQSIFESFAQLCFNRLYVVDPTDDTLLGTVSARDLVAYFLRTDSMIQSQEGQGGIPSTNTGTTATSTTDTAMMMTTSMYMEEQ